MSKDSQPSGDNPSEPAVLNSSDDEEELKPAERRASGNPAIESPMRSAADKIHELYGHPLLFEPSEDEVKPNSANRGYTSSEDSFDTMSANAPTVQLLDEMQLGSERLNQFILNLDGTIARRRAAHVRSAEQKEEREAIRQVKDRLEICGFPIRPESSESEHGQKESTRGCPFGPKPVEDELVQLLRQLLTVADRWEPALASLELATERLTTALHRSAEQKETQGDQTATRRPRFNKQPKLIEVAEKLEALELQIDSVLTKLAAQTANKMSEKGVGIRGNSKEGI